MRIIGGKHRGRRFEPPRKTPARPTTDIAKEGLFNVLSNTWDFEQIKFLDLFGGTGNIAFEFASRGCPRILSVELDAANVRFIQRMADQLDMPIQVLRMNVFKFLEKSNEQFDVIFAGPPYPLENLDEIPDKVFEAEVLEPGGWLVLEHNPKHNFEQHPRFLKLKKYGSTIFAIFEQEDAVDESSPSE
jgi:16S rRNA (guanine(966)-N(2))-methyltransferase RsmD